MNCMSICDYGVGADESTKGKNKIIIIDTWSFYFFYILWVTWGFVKYYWIDSNCDIGNTGVCEIVDRQ